MKTFYFTIVFFFAGLMLVSAQPGSRNDWRINGPEINGYRNRNSNPFGGGTGPVIPAGQRNNWTHTNWNHNWNPINRNHPVNLTPGWNHPIINHIHWNNGWNNNWNNGWNNGWNNNWNNGWNSGWNNNYSNPGIIINNNYSPYYWWRDIRFSPAGISPIYWGGRHYYYHDGNFFNIVNGIYQVVLPIVGLILNSLPTGARVLPGYNNYYYYHGIYYQPYNNGYRVVAPPVGACLTELPYFAKETYYNGIPLYTYDNVYIEPITLPNGTVCYRVLSAIY